MPNIEKEQLDFYKAAIRTLSRLAGKVTQKSKQKIQQIKKSYLDLKQNNFEKKIDNFSELDEKSLKKVFETNLKDYNKQIDRLYTDGFIDEKQHKSLQLRRGNFDTHDKQGLIKSNALLSESKENLEKCIQIKDERLKEAQSKLPEGSVLDEQDKQKLFPKDGIGDLQVNKTMCLAQKNEVEAKKYFDKNLSGSGLAFEDVRNLSDKVNERVNEITNDLSKAETVKKMKIQARAGLTPDKMKHVKGFDKDALKKMEDKMTKKVTPKKDNMEI